MSDGDLHVLVQDFTVENATNQARAPDLRNAERMGIRELQVDQEKRVSNIERKSWGCTL